MKTTFFACATAVTLANAALASTPVAVSDSTFKEGNYWVWQYQHEDGNITSWEKYQVIENNNGILTVEMASKFPGENTFSSHHRIVASLQKCLNAFDNPFSFPNWRLEGFYFKDGENWVKGGRGRNVQAFEEKFNCMSIIDEREIQYIYETQQYNSPVIGSTEVFRNKRRFPRSGQYPSWYFNTNNELDGIAARKVFNPEEPGRVYEFNLVEWGNKNK